MPKDTNLCAKAIIPLLSLVIIECSFAATDLQDKINAARDKVFPALVHVQPISEVFEGGKKTKQTAVGSGVIVNKEGFVITNYHVAGKAVKALCTLGNKERIQGELVGGDPLTDLAVLKLDLSDFKGELKWAEIGDSSKLETGQFVLAMGSPLSLSRSLSEGVVSCPDRSLGDMELDGGEKTGGYHTWIQTTAAINFGNSGGPLVNLDGEIVGINTRTIVGADGLGFSIPSNVVKEIARQIMEKGSVERSWIGVDLQPHQELETWIADQKGVLVSSVEPNSPAAEAGVREGDMIQKINGQIVDARFEEEIPTVLQRISDIPVGSTLTLSIARNGGAMELAMATREMGKALGEEKEFPEWGLSAQSLTLTKMLNLNRTKRDGVLVSGVSGVTTKDPTDLVRDDILLEIDGNEISGMETLNELFDRYSETRPDRFVVKAERNGVIHFTVLYPKYGLDETQVE